MRIFERQLSESFPEEYLHKYLRLPDTISTPWAGIRYIAMQKYIIPFTTGIFSLILEGTRYNVVYNQPGIQLHMVILTLFNLAISL